MCGIVGYIGKQEAQQVLIEGLKRLEYRGYDSAGIAVVNSGKLAVTSEHGKLKVLESSLNGRQLPGQLALAIRAGHTANHAKKMPTRTKIAKANLWWFTMGSSKITQP